MRESQQIAAERRGEAEHAHRTGTDHLTGHESSRQALEHSNHAYVQAQQEHQNADREHAAHHAHEADIAALAYRLWEERGCPEGSPEEDWLHAVEQLRHRH